MASSLVTDAGTLIRPGAKSSIRVVRRPSGLATNGILMIVGEAESGPRFDEEEKLGLNSFGPDEAAEVAAKYTSGPLVDAYNGAIAASNDDQIVGSLQRVILVKTNGGVKATSTIPAVGSGNWATVEARLEGTDGNMITRTVSEKTAEVLPSTGATVLASPQQTTTVAFRVNGGSELTATLTAGDTPATMKASIDAVSGVAATGGVNRAIVSAGMVSGGDTVSMVQDSGRQCHVTTSVGWSVVPTVGDIMLIPTGSPFAAANEGTYAVTAVSATRIDAYKLLDAAGAGAVVTNPTTEGPFDIAATTDVQAYSPVVVTLEAGAVVPGLGKSLEIANSGSFNLSDLAYTFAGATAVPPAAAADWVSTSADPYAIFGTEQRMTINFARASDAVSEDHDTEGFVVLALGYDGTTGSAVIDDGIMTITVTGGSGTSPPAIDLSDYSTVADLVVYLNTLTGFSAASGSAALGQRNPVDLDPGTYGIGSTQGANTGRIKQDGARILKKITDDGFLAIIAPISPATVLTGAPDEVEIGFLSGGSKGATTNDDVSEAFTALEGVRGNFVMVAISRDATADIDDGLTDAGSTYDIESVNANLRTHVLKMSTLKRSRYRQGFASFRGSFEDAKSAAGNMASNRIAMFFQDVRDLDSTGTVVQLQPWAAAAKAAGMQLAAGYRPIVHKGINISSALQAAADYDDEQDSDVEDALLAGLCPISPVEEGGWHWESDQTTYSKDDNEILNSISATYNADIVQTTSAKRMEKAFVGQSVADVPASVALSTLEGILDDMKQLKFISASDEAPKGYKDVRVKLVNGNAFLCSATIFVSTALKFIVITFLANVVTQSAG